MDDSEHRPRGGELAARVRAAAGWADLDRPAFGEAIGYGKETISRLYSGAKIPDGDDLKLIATACKVPLWFLEHGFDPPRSDTERALRDEINSLRVAQLETASAVLAMQRAIAELERRDRPRKAGEGE